MTTFLALYRGRTIEDAELIAVSIDSDLIQHAAAHIIANAPMSHDDTVLNALHERRMDALQLLMTEISAQEGRE